ncbi:hypothetical protein H8S90_04360 [Olivibacter sp. SDN3]|uniref:hypothetical protein n=1 Tax=Olivibacter sp. SDN3 TaxID=2764720 RepID=UPI00165120A3|nr:hypothetical protein [Olivibacter sp. SDN3]QNL50830.1 hypothetical protein H8S90_04360 [Olivibacter sp. SDN3]
MRTYKILCCYICALVVASFPAAAQGRGDDSAFEKHILGIVEHAERLGQGIARKVKDIDTDELVRNAEKIARLSEEHAEKLADKFQEIDWDQMNSPFQHIEPYELKADANSVEERKTIQKVYMISKNTPLTIDNRYGKVQVNTWSKNEIKVDITIRAVEASGSKAQEIINSVTISESKSPNSISLNTQINRGKSSWWNNMVSGSNRGVEINYNIYLPKSNELSINNKYGSVVLPDLDGNLKVDVSYGSLNAGKLSGNNISISSSYGSAKIASVKDAALDFKYGSIDLGEANNIKLNIGYCGGSNVGRLMNSGDISVKYSGGFSVGLDKAINKLNLDAAYSPSNIKIDPNANFTYQVNVSYGNFNPGKCIVTKEDPAPDSRGPKLHKSYSGYYGKDASNHIAIDSKYGTIKFQ